MRRRTLLTALGAGAVTMPLAGCSGRDAPGTASPGTPSPTDRTERRDDRTETDTRTEEPMTSGIPRTVSLDDLSDEDLRETFGVAARVTVLEPRVTDAHTARVRVGLESTTGESRTLTYTRETCDLNLIVGRYRDGDARLLLLSTEQAWDRTDPDCWVPDGRNLNCGIPAMDHRVTVAPDDPLEWTFRLWADPETYPDACMPLETCRFERTLRHDGTGATLSFSLSVDQG